MKYTFQMDGGAKQVLETRSTESPRHIILKILGYLLYSERQPQIEIRVSPNKRDYKPDVVAFDAAGEISLWVDCGQIGLHKVEDLTRSLPNAEIVIIKVTAHEMESYAREAARKVKRNDRVRYIGFDAAFVPHLIAQLGHINTVQWKRDKQNLTVVFNGKEFRTILWTYDAGSGRAVHVCT